MGQIWIHLWNSLKPNCQPSKMKSIFAIHKGLEILIEGLNSWNRANIEWKKVNIDMEPVRIFASFSAVSD